jgi:hypothetical protein
MHQLVLQQAQNRIQHEVYSDAILAKLAAIKAAILALEGSDDSTAVSDARNVDATLTGIAAFLGIDV